MADDTKSAEEVMDDGKLDADFIQEIEDAVDNSSDNNAIKDIVEDDKEEKKEEEPKDEVKEEESPSEESSEDTEEDSEEFVGVEDESDSIDEDLIERAVLAGIPMRRAKEAPSEEFLEDMIAIAKKSAEAEAEKEDEVSEEATSQIDDLLEKLPKLDSDEYDENLIAMFDSLKDVISGLQTTVVDQQSKISGLQKNIVSSEQSFLDTKIAALDKGFENVFGKGKTVNLTKAKEKAARAKLQRHISLVEEDAKLDGETLSQDEAFDRALKSAFGDLVNKVKGKKRSVSSKARSERAINRPRTTDGRFGSNKMYDDHGTEEDRTDDAIKAVQEIIDSRA